MSDIETFKIWLELLVEKPVFSTHEHHMESAKQQQLDLNLLFNSSYVGWCRPAPDLDSASRSAWLDSLRTNSYYVWLSKALFHIYGVREITSDNWDALSARIAQAHQDPHWHLQIMKKHGNYTGFLEDCYWDSGSAVGYPDFVTPIYRLDMWMMGFHPDSLTNENTSSHDLFDEPPSFDQYMERFEQELRTRREQIVGLKCASAYQRTIAFREATEEEARAVFGMKPEDATEQQRNAFGDYVLARGLELAAELDLPVQFHTGLARLDGSSPMKMERLIATHPRNRIVLFHGGFPWIYETAALAHQYPNVVIDINWLPLISTSAATYALHTYVDVLRDSGSVTWGGDTWTGEEAVGAVFAFRHILAKLLAERVAEGLWKAEDAERFADKIMYENALNIYGISRQKAALIVHEQRLLPQEEAGA